MKCTISILIAALLSCTISHAQQLDTLIRGVFLFPRGNVSFDSIANRLHCNTVQFSSGYNESENEQGVLTNLNGVKVIHQRKFLDSISWGQRMVYEAEQDSNAGPLKNYFAERPSGRSYPPEGPPFESRQCMPQLHQPGYMVKSAEPNNQYHLHTHWFATFRLKIDPPAPAGDSVVTCIVRCANNGQILNYNVLLTDQFGGTGSYRDFTVEFVIPCPALNSPANGPGILTGGIGQAPTMCESCVGVELQVYWYGYVTTYLDKVVVEDSLGRNLFAGGLDQQIKDTAKHYTGPVSPNHSRFFLIDEPWMNQYLAFNYVANRIKDTLGHDLPSAGSVTDTWEKDRRFLAEGQPSYLMIDPYFVFSDVPHPSITSNDTADINGIANWNYSTYTTTLQAYLDNYLTYRFRPAAEAILAIQPAHSRPPLIHVPQLHGIWYLDVARYRRLDLSPSLRPPSPSEIRLSYCIGLTYGAKGLLAYPCAPFSGPFQSTTVVMPGIVSYPPQSGGKYIDHSSNYEVYFGHHVYTGASEKWDEVAAMNSRLQQIGDTILTLTWVGARSWSTTQTSSGNWSDSIVTAVATKDTLGNPDTPPFVEIGHLQRETGTDYIVVVNRRSSTRETAGEYDTRDITVTLGNPVSQNCLVTDIESGRAWVTKRNGKFTDRFRPGDGKIYRLEGATVAGTRVFPQLRFVGGAVLTLASNANITACGKMDTVNVILGGNAVFKADTGSTMVVARDSAFVFGSGSELDVNGTVTTASNVNWTIGYGGKLKVLPAATTNLGTYGTINVIGNSSAIGDANRRIPISGQAGALAGGVYWGYGSTDTLEYCSMKYLIQAVSIASNCAATIHGNQFLKCSTAISSDGLHGSPLIEDNTVDSCSIGFNVFTQAGTPTIRRDTIRACTYGMVFEQMDRSMVDDNRLSHNHIGILVINSLPALHHNIVELSDSVGVLCISSANPRFGDNVIPDPGYNVIRNNTASQIYSSNSNPFLGVGKERPAGGWNSLYDAQGETLIVAQNSSYVTAEWNWWGSAKPPDKQFIMDEKSVIDHQNPLPSDPNGWMRPTGGQVTSEGKGGQTDDPPLTSISPEQALLRQALLLRGQRDYLRAVAIYANLITAEPNADESQIAVVELRNTYHDYLHWSGDTTLQATLETYLRTQISNHPNALVKRIARKLRAAELNNRRDFGTSLQEYQQLLQSATLDEDRRECLFALFDINARGLRSRSDAQTYLTQMQSQFPNDVRTDIAAIRFRGMIDSSTNNGMQRASVTDNSMQVQLPLRFNVSQNYPNPFNPLTTINFDLPVDIHTHLKLYDVLGREVASLVDEDRQAGYHRVSFDGGRLSSGVYFYRLQAGKFSETKKLVLLR